MSFASCLAPPPPRLPRGRAGLAPPSSSTAGSRPSLGFGPTRAATIKVRHNTNFSTQTFVLSVASQCHPRFRGLPSRNVATHLANQSISILLQWAAVTQEQDGSTTSDDGAGFEYVEQVEISGVTEVKEEEGGCPRGEERDYEKGDWFGSVLKIKENLQDRVSKFWNERWMVPWTGQTIAQVMFLWIATFWLVGSWIVPFLAHTAGFSKETLTHRGQALYSLLTDITEGLAGIAIIHQCLGRFRPLPPGWFEFKLEGRWHWDVAFGCLLFPLVNLLSHINISLVHMSSGPVAGVSSVEQSIVARDPVAMALYAVVVTICAPIWEEIVFRGFLLPSLTRYMPLPWSILVSAAAFALAHFNAQRVLPLIFLGVVMGGVFARSRNLLASMVLHSLWNGFVFLDLMK